MNPSLSPNRFKVAANTIVASNIMSQSSSSSSEYKCLVKDCDGKVMTTGHYYCKNHFKFSDRKDMTMNDFKFLPPDMILHFFNSVPFRCDSLDCCNFEWKTDDNGKGEWKQCDIPFQINLHERTFCSTHYAKDSNGNRIPVKFTSGDYIKDIFHRSDSLSVHILIKEGYRAGQAIYHHTKDTDKIVTHPSSGFLLFDSTTLGDKKNYTEATQKKMEEVKQVIDFDRLENIAKVTNEERKMFTCIHQNCNKLVKYNPYITRDLSMTRDAVPNVCFFCESHLDEYNEKFLSLSAKKN